MKKWKIKGSKEFKQLLSKLKSDDKISTCYDGDAPCYFYGIVDSRIETWDINGNDFLDYEEVTVKELEQLYYPKSTSTNFIVGKWYKTTNHQFYGKFLSIEDDKFTASERSLNDDYIGGKHTFSSGYPWIPATQEQIDAFLPDEHPDKSYPLPIEKWSVGSYVVFCKDFTSVCPIGFVDKIITGLDVMACVHLEKYLTLHIDRENEGEIKWFATKQEAEDFAKTLTTVEETVKQTKTMETIEEIQAECKRRFPIGCKFKSPSTGKIYTLNQTNTTYEIVRRNAIDGGENQSYLYYNGEYAELFSESEQVEPVKSKYLIAAEKAMQHFRDAGFYVGCEYESTKGTIYKSIWELTIYSKNSKDCNIDCGGGFLWEYERNGQTDVYGKLLIEDKLMEDKPQSMEREYQIGDRVECVNEYAHISVGMQGVIVEIITANIGVSWDTLTKGHDCDGRCSVGTGYYIMRNNVRLIGTSFPNIPTSQELNTYGLQVGDTLDVNVLNTWTVIEGNRSTDSKTEWHRGEGVFIGNRVIKSFHLIHGHVGFEVSGTGTVYLKAKGFKEFADSYYSKESKQDCFEMFDIVECVEARGPIKIGMQGVIREMNYKDKPFVGVEWFNFDNGHDLDEILQTNSGYRLDYDQIKLISKSNLSLNSLGYSSESKVDYDKRVGTSRWEAPHYISGVDYPTPFQLQYQYNTIMHQREQLIQKESNQTQELLTLPTNKIYVRKSKSIK